MASNPGTARAAEDTPTTLIPSALHFGASSAAIVPTPKIPTVFPLSSFTGKRSHFRPACWLSDRGRLRASESIASSAASETGAP